jgi:hypothetical protein
MSRRAACVKAVRPRATVPQPYMTRLGIASAPEEQFAIEHERFAVATSDGRPVLVRPTARLLLSCPARPGTATAVWLSLSSTQADPVTVDQRTSAAGRMFMRAELDLPRDQLRPLEQRFEDTVAKPFAIDFRIADVSSRKRIAVLVSRHDHCLVDLLWRWQRGELDADIDPVDRPVS